MKGDTREQGWIVLGGGGHARVVLDLLTVLGADVLGYTDPSGASALGEVPCLGGDDALDAYAPDRVLLANGLGSVGEPAARAALYARFTAGGYTFPPLVHPGAVVSASAALGAGTQVMAGAVLQAGVRTGANVLVNTRASVDHGCVLGDHVHVAPGVTLSGDVRVGARTHLGTGAVVVQGVAIGAGCLVAAGAVVVRDLPDGAAVVGVPARPFSR